MADRPPTTTNRMTLWSRTMEPVPPTAGSTIAVTAATVTAAVVTAVAVTAAVYRRGSHRVRPHCA